MKWSNKYTSCQKCGTSERPHKGKGLCTKCYAHMNHVLRGSRLQYTCDNCGVTFTPKMPRSKKIDHVFCSPECSAEYKTNKPRGFYKSKLQLENDVQNLIRNEQRYLTRKEICTALNITDTTIAKFGLSIIGLHKSVGVKKNKFRDEDVVYYLLKPSIPDLVTNHIFEDCRSPKGYALRFDLYSADLGLCIEVDGEHHSYNTNIDALKFVQLCDSIKDKYVEERGIVMVRIPTRRWRVIEPDFVIGCIHEQAGIKVTIDL